MVISTHLPPPVERRRLGIGHPHIVLHLGHVFGGRSLLRERPRQHELGLEHLSGSADKAVECRPHPPDDRMPDLPLDVVDDLPGIALEPVAVEGLGHDPELDDEVAREVFGLDLAPLLAPEAKEGGFILSHDDADVRAADEVAALGRFDERSHSTLPAISSAARWIAPLRSDARSTRIASASERSSPPGVFWAASSRITVRYAASPSTTWFR